MKPIEVVNTSRYPLPGGYHKTVFAKDQPEYLPLPAIVSNAPDGLVVTRWTFTWRERLSILFGANFYLKQYTFQNPLQPIRPSVGDDELYSGL